MKQYRSMGIICVSFLLILSRSVEAQQKYPNRPIEMVVPFAAGGSADVAIRVFADDLSRVLKVPVNVVNKAGGTGIQGITYVAKGKKDGYTILGTADTPLIIVPAISKEVTYDSLKDITPIGNLGFSYTVFGVNSDSPFKTLKDVVEFARKNPSKLKNGTGGIGTQGYFNLEIICSKEKIKITSIPFGSGGEALPALLGGHVDMTTNALAALGASIKAGKVRALATASRRRIPEFPDIPTTAEIGYPEANFSVWFAVFTPAGVPQEVLDVLVPAVEKVFKSPEVMQRATKVGIDPDYMGPAEIRKVMESQIRMVEKVAREANIQKR